LEKGFRVKIFAQKIGTTHLYTDQGKHQVVTALKLLKTIVGKIKSVEVDGYNSLVLIQPNEKAKPKKTITGQFKGHNVRKIIEERTDEKSEARVNDEFSSVNLKVGDQISIVATTKGKGFQGTVKRHGFQTGPKTHGSRNYRRPGSIGMTTPSRIPVGKKMAGHMGAVKNTAKKVQVERVDEKTDIIWVKGHIAGPNRGQIVIVK